MANRLTGLGLFFADMYKHTVGKMTGVLSIILALAPVLCPAFFAGDRGLLHSKWTWETAAAISFLFAAYSAWSEQHEARLVVERKHFDARPLLSFEAHSVEGPTAWEDSPTPVTFTIHHLGGRPPTAISFAPIPSYGGKFLLKFDALPHIAPANFVGVGFEVNEVGETYSAKTIEVIRYTRKLVLRDYFLADGSPELGDLIYELQVNFHDGEERQSQSFYLVFDRLRFRFLRSTAMPTPQ